MDAIDKFEKDMENMAKEPLRGQLKIKDWKGNTIINMENEPVVEKINPMSKDVLRDDQTTEYLTEEEIMKKYPQNTLKNYLRKLYGNKDGK